MKPSESETGGTAGGVAGGVRLSRWGPVLRVINVVRGLTRIIVFLNPVLIAFI